MFFMITFIQTFKDSSKLIGFALKGSSNLQQIKTIAEKFQELSDS